MLGGVVGEKEADLLQLDQLAHRPVAHRQVGQQLQRLVDDHLAVAPVLQVRDHLAYDDAEHHGLVVQSEHFGEAAVHLARLLHLVADVDFAELFKEGEESQLQLLRTSLRTKKILS